MTKTDYRQFAAALGTLAEIHNRELSALATKAYFRALQEFDIAAVETAIGKAITSTKWFPKPVELIESLRGRQATAEQVADQQWTGIVDAIRTVGAYGQPSFSDPITHHLITRRFPWAELCAKTEKELVWTHKAFIAAYTAADTAEYKPQIASPKAIRPLLKNIGRI